MTEQMVSDIVNGVVGLAIVIATACIAIAYVRNNRERK